MLKTWPWPQVAILALSVSLLGCQTTIKPEAPNRSDLKPEPPRQISTMAVPVRISSQQVQAIAEAQFPINEPIYWTTGQSIGHGVDMQMGIYRSGPVSVSSAGGCLNLGVDMAIRNGRLDWSTRILGIRVSKMAGFGGSGNITARVCPSVTPAWNLTSTIEPSFRWLEGAYVNVNIEVANFNIGVAGLAESAIRAKLNSIGKSIAGMLENLPVRENIKTAWTAVQKPILLTKPPASTTGITPASVTPSLPEVYLIAEPTMIGLGPLDSEGTEIVATPNITSFLKLQLGKPDPASQPKPTPLPANAGAIDSKGVNISVKAVVPYDEANKVAENRLKDKPIELGEKKSVSIYSIEVFPDGERLLVKAGFKGRLGTLPFDDIKGHLYLRGTPRYSNEDRTLWIDNLDFEVGTSNMFVKSASLLASPIIKKSLEKALRFELGPKLDPLLDKAKGGVSGFEIVKGVQLNAKATSIELDYIYVGPKAISVALNAKGNANIVLEPIKP